jgi:hypothetical protein
MPEIGTSGSMSGDGKRAIGKASSTAPILDSTRLSAMPESAESGHLQFLPHDNQLMQRYTRTTRVTHRCSANDRRRSCGLAGQHPRSAASRISI